MAYVFLSGGGWCRSVRDLTYGALQWRTVLKVLLESFSILFGLWGLIKPQFDRAAPDWWGGLRGGIAGFTSFYCPSPVSSTKLLFCLQCQLSKGTVFSWEPARGFSWPPLSG